MKRTGAASVAALLAVKSMEGDAEAAQGSSTERYKIWREIVYTNGIAGALDAEGSGSSMPRARAKALNSLAEKLKAKCTVVSDTTHIETREGGLKLLDFQKVSTGTPASQHIGLTTNGMCDPNPYYTLPEDDTEDVWCNVEGFLIGASGTIRFEWTWGH